MLYTRKAAEDKVLCNGYTYTGLGGEIASSSEEELYKDWQEMPEEAAIILCEQGGPDAEITDEELGAMVREVL